MNRNTILTVVTIMLMAFSLPVAAHAVETGDRAAAHGAGLVEGFTLHIDAGLGYDSNAYRSPDSSYKDLAQTGSPTVDPKPRSGFFVPLEARAVYERPIEARSALVLSYGFDGDFYLGSKVDNANVYTHTLRAGPRFTLKKQGKHKDTLYFGVLVKKQRKLYIDRADGELKLSSATRTDISERYTYLGMGLEAGYRSRVGAVQYDLDAVVEGRNYDDPGVVSEYDHRYTAIGGKVHYSLSKATRLSASYKHYSRDYSDRPSRNSSGKALTSNARLEYAYNSFGLGFRQRLSKEWTAYADIKRTYRKDKFAGYHDYTRDKVKVRLIYHDKQAGLRLRLAAALWKRSYDNAFAFDVPAGGEKKYDGVNIDAKLEVKKTAGRSYWAGAGYEAQNTTDKRYEYDRYLASAGVKWVF